ncbi:MAG TPA: ABC transporter permease [Blastocatellia bacterium]|nr:ABC transporter permease [Blastocatellia bacterium]
MISLRKTLTVTRYEFTVTVMRKTFLMVAFGMPLFMGGSMAVGALVSVRQFKPPQAPAIALVDEAKVLKPEALSAIAKADQPVEKGSFLSAAQSKASFTSYADLDQALGALLREEVSACYLIEEDYLASGNITTFERESKLPSRQLPAIKEQLYDSIRASLLDGRVTGMTRDRLLEKPKFQSKEVSPQGRIKPMPSVMHKILSMVGPLFFFMMLMMSIFMSSTYLLQSLALEKQNRVMEVLLSSVTHEELLAGKILGLGLVGLMQTNVYAALLGYPLLPFLGAGGWQTLLLSPLYVILGYLLFASLMVATGIFFSGEQESAQLAGLWMLVIAAPGVILALSPGLDSWIAKALSFFPLTAPTTMLLRLSWAKAGPFDVLISIAALIAGIYLAIRFAAKVFRLASLMYGKPPNLPELLRVIRAA